jgi:peptidyl-prolyl cis-trans isomerase SurA
MDSHDALSYRLPMKWIRLGLVAGIAGLFVGPACAQTLLLNGVAAVVNRSVITFDDVRSASMRPLEAARRLTRDDADFDRRASQIQKDVLEQLIERELIVREFETKGYNLPESIIDEIVDKQMKDEFGDRLTLTKTLRLRGQTYESWRRDQRDQFVIAQMTVKNINQNIVVSPKKIEKHYAENSEKYRVGERAKIRMILIDKSRHSAGESSKIAAAALARLTGGEEFAQVADSVSDDARRFKGGDRGWVENKDADLRKELRTWVFKPESSGLSELIEVEGAIFIVKVEEKKAAGILPLSEVRQDVEGTLRNEERDRLRKGWINRLRVKQFVAYF